MSVIAFCLDDKPAYLLHMRVAVRSLRHLYGADAPEVVCVYAGNDEAVLRGVAEEGIRLARYNPVLSAAKLPPSCQRVLGCFLKLELALVPELADCKTVLYCDTDVLFMKRLDALFALTPHYMAMTKEDTLPFFHPHAQLSYTWLEKDHTVKLPFPIWTFNSGVVVFNLERLRRYDTVHAFLAFCLQNAGVIGNFDQSLLNYFFGKRITKLDSHWNHPPYRGHAMTNASIIHFQGPKPWEVNVPHFNDLRVNDYNKARAYWKTWLTPAEATLVDEWERTN